MVKISHYSYSSYYFQSVFSCLTLYISFCSHNERVYQRMLDVSKRGTPATKNIDIHGPAGYNGNLHKLQVYIMVPLHVKDTCYYQFKYRKAHLTRHCHKGWKRYVSNSINNLLDMILQLRGFLSCMGYKKVFLKLSEAI